MKASFSSKQLQDAVKLATSVTKGPEYVNLRANKGGNMEVLASGNDVNVRLVIPESKTEKSGEVTVPVAQLLGLTRNRAEMTIEVAGKKGSTVQLSAKNYKTEFATPPHAPVTVDAGEGKKGIKFNKALQVLLEDAIARITLRSVYTDDPIFVFVGSDGKKGSTVACGDQYHFAHYHHAKVDLGKHSFTLPLATFQTLTTLSNKTPYKLFIEGSQVFASNANMAVTMPLSQAGEELNLEGFNGLIKNFGKSDSWAEVSKELLSAALDNIDSVYEAGVPLEIGVKGGKLSLSFRTGHSSVKETIKVDKSKWKDKAVVKCDPALLQDTLNSNPSKSVKLEVLNSQMIFIRDKMEDVTTHHACCVI